MVGSRDITDGDRILIGAPLHDLDTGSILVDAGCAYVFDVNTGLEISKLHAGDPASSDWYGWSLGLHNGTAIIGSYRGDDSATNSGCAYLYPALPLAE